MTETTAASDVAAQQKTAAAFIGSILNSGADPLLKAQADILVTVETTMTDWLHRRQEGLAETQTLVARLRTSSDPADFLKAQQEWISGAIRRLSADAAAYQSATQQFVDRARSWFPNGIDGTTNVAAASDTARPAGKPLRVANKPE